MRPKFICLALLGVLSLSLPSLAAAVPAGSTDTLAGLFQNLKWRQIGPACFGGRIDDIEAVAGDPKIIFVAAASGGIFKSVNNGLTWKPVFDEEGTSLSIGDLAIAPSDPNIVWAGTGEPNSRQSSSWGDGYISRSTAARPGVGLPRYAAFAVSSSTRKPDIVFAAALGHLWGPTRREARRTKDGGKTCRRSFHQR
jgi:hypothetical protein